MNTDLDDIKQTLIGISKNESMLETLMEFERTLDNLEIFAYRNWIKGELVSGPKVGRHWYTTTWMYPHRLMPDPLGGMRLISIGARVRFGRGTFRRAAPVKTTDLFHDRRTEETQTEEHAVWLVSIDLPVRFIRRGLEDLEGVMIADIHRVSDELDQQLESPEGGEEPTDEFGGDEFGEADFGGEEFQ